LLGVVLDHQNKDMILFEGKVAGKYMALTRPLGEVYFAYPEDSEWARRALDQHRGVARRPALEAARRAGAARAQGHQHESQRIGGGSQPVLTPEGWMLIYHGVEKREAVGVYRSFWALLDRDDPSKILRLEDGDPVLEANPALTADIAHQLVAMVAARSTRSIRAPSRTAMATASAICRGREPARPSCRSRRRRDLAVADLPIADGGFRL
jgi:hypothetical protein